jgi:hypothetical protein
MIEANGTTLWFAVDGAALVPASPTTFEPV